MQRRIELRIPDWDQREGSQKIRRTAVRWNFCSVEVGLEVLLRTSCMTGQRQWNVATLAAYMSREVA